MNRGRILLGTGTACLLNSDLRRRLGLVTARANSWFLLVDLISKELNNHMAPCNLPVSTLVRCVSGQDGEVGLLGLQPACSIEEEIGVSSSALSLVSL